MHKTLIKCSEMRWGTGSLLPAAAAAPNLKEALSPVWGLKTPLRVREGSTVLRAFTVARRGKGRTLFGETEYIWDMVKTGSLLLAAAAAPS